MKPTKQLYDLLQQAYDHFNHSLFVGVLPDCVITLQREKRTMGYFSAERWSNERGYKAHEIALNPVYFVSRNLLEISQTIVHEQCHLWQYVFGKKQSRTCYHNREWADKMEELGLMPSDTGLPGGKRTGQFMSDYPIPNGLFVNACENLIREGFRFDWVDRFAKERNHPEIKAISSNLENQADSANIDTELTLSDGGPVEIQDDLFEMLFAESDQEVVEILTSPLLSLMPSIEVEYTQAGASSSSNKTKYTCPKCLSNVWGKDGLEITCTPCQSPFQASH